ncbi:conserved membrane protein of unknown function [Streptomyces ambofaciens ATCC 23877]|uniref:Uncharacterized protein n=1 Tax=Streptomyces ambofaciens (strain ATCC 23877 / 3486 / DSM 40053 / JCM 4204 / NBRC 12836 / NRRL B-2516) TaxID=278992 RepID=A0A0K2B1A8_STRA7|nr:hypothetical protein [Streptomyces ambofaciens]AKZ58892.1 conserved membrane protein of unknown function [Streptomyces ambofaciens ATCC 23877]
MTVPEARAGVRASLGYWAGTVPVRVLGAAAVVTAWRPWARVSGAPDALALGCAVLFALWAAPSLDRRPSLESTRWSHRLLRHRTTVLAAGVVVIAALGDPAWWEGACLTGLLVACLVTSETWPWRWGRGVVRVWAEAAAACAGAGVVAVAAALPVTGAGTGPGRVVAAGAVVGLAVAGVVVGLAVAGGGVLSARWRGRERHPR